MSQWARANPERMSEIASLPANEQAGALRDAMPMPPDEDAARIEAFERGFDWEGEA